jgi:hypothetical protein
MKLFINQIGIIAIFVGVLMPISALSHNLSRTKAIKHADSIMLAQNNSYRYLVDAANKQEKLANQASTNFFVAFEQLLSAPNSGEAVKIANVLIKTSGQTALHFQQSSKLGLQSLPYYAADPSAQTALDTTYRIHSELAQVFRNYNQLSIQTHSAFQANDGAKAKVLGTKFALLKEQRTKLMQISQQVSQAYINRSNAVNAQLINNLNTQMRNGVIQRGQATKCMVSNLPYGSPTQVASNASGYCNSP